MRKLIILIGTLSLISQFLLAQNKCTLKIGDLDMTGLKSGDPISIPVSMPQVDGVVTGWEFYILFDNTVFSWEPDAFLANKTHLFKGSWFENINLKVHPGMDQFAANWLDPEFIGIVIPPDEILFTLELIYNGGLKPGDDLKIIWDFSSNESSKSEVNRKTSVVNGSFEFYEIIPIDATISK